MDSVVVDMAHALPSLADCGPPVRSKKLSRWTRSPEREATPRPRNCHQQRGGTATRRRSSDRAHSGQDRNATWVRPAVHPGRAESGPGYGVVVKVKPEAGTEPLDVGGLKVTFTVSTSSPGSNTPLPFESWKSWIVADVNATSVMFSVHIGFGQPGAPGIGVTGAPVTVVIVTFPFLM